MNAELANSRVRDLGPADAAEPRPRLAHMRRGHPHAEAVRRILRLPEGQKFSTVKVSIGTDETATATVTFLLSKAQLIELVESAEG